MNVDATARAGIHALRTAPRILYALSSTFRLGSGSKRFFRKTIGTDAFPYTHFDMDDLLGYMEDHLLALSLVKSE
jgi:hypothetical protein